MTAGRGDPAHRPAAVLAGAATLVGGVFTLAVLVLPFFPAAHPAPALHVMLETVNAVVAVLVGFLLYGRLRQHHRLQDLRLGLGLLTVAVANLLLTAVPEALPSTGAPGLSQWTPLAVRLLGTVLLVGGALTPATRTVDRRSALLGTAGLLGALVALGGVGVALAGSGPVTDLVRVTDAASRSVVAHPVVLGVQVLALVLYATAGLALVRQADRTGDELLRWMAAGCVLAAWARVHYLLFPSLYSDYVYTGDLLRLGFYGLLLVGAAREITSLWRDRAQSAVLEDRRRIARDLHDGLIQELAYIHAQSQRLASRPGDEVAVRRIGGAAGRAIDESRRAIAALSREEDEDFPVVLRHALDEMASRYDVKVVADLDRETEVDGPMAEALLRITGEAVRNAVRHGRAGRVDVRLTAQPVSLTVVDDGSGFDACRPDGGRAGGFGLRSMRERAAGIGAELTLDSAPGEGTAVRVSWV